MKETFFGKGIALNMHWGDVRQASASRLGPTGVGVKWLTNYPIFTPDDYLDILDAPEADTATKGTLVAAHLDVTSELRPAMR
jgi:hypothetical protein